MATLGIQAKLFTGAFNKVAGVLWTLLVALVMVAGCGVTQTESPPSTSAEVVGTAKLNVEFGELDRSAKILDVDCSADATVFSLMENAQSAGDFEFVHRQNLTGSPASIFVDSIEGVENKDGKFWVYYVNGNLAKEGCGTMTVKPDDEVRWVYGKPAKSLTSE